MSQGSFFARRAGFVLSVFVAGAAFGAVPLVVVSVLAFAAACGFASALALASPMGVAAA
jgi:hypothetical protein